MLFLINSSFYVNITTFNCQKLWHMIYNSAIFQVKHALLILDRYSYIHFQEEKTEPWGNLGGNLEKGVETGM